MAIDVSAGTDGEKLLRAWRKLSDPKRRKRLQTLEDYFRGSPPLPEGMEALRPVVQDLFKTSRTNLAELIVEALRERLRLTGIRTAADDGEAGDQAAWSLWRRCGVPVELTDTLRRMFSLGDGYMIVGHDDALQRPVVTSEHPSQVVTFHDPRHQRQVLFGAKFFYDPESQRDFGYLYLPGRVRVAVLDRSQASGAGSGLFFDPRQWSWAEDRGDLLDADGVPLYGGALPDGMDDVVPIVRFRNLEGVGEFERHTDLLDRINRMILRRVVIATYQAFQQRAVKGELPEKDDDGNVIDWDKELEAGPDALWLLPPAVEIWESGQVDMSGILNSVKADILLLAAVTRTPLSMFTPDAAAQSAEGASFMREGLVFKAEDRQERTDDAAAQVASLMFRFAGDEKRGQLDKVQPVWAPVERYSLAEQMSAWSQAVGLPFETKLRTILRMSPDEIARVKTEQQAEAFNQALTAIQAQAAQPAVPAV